MCKPRLRGGIGTQIPNVFLSGVSIGTLGEGAFPQREESSDTSHFLEFETFWVEDCPKTF